MSGSVDLEQTATVLRGGEMLRAWIECGGTPERSLPFLRLRLHWTAYWFDRLAKLTADRCAATPLPHTIVFIVGLWRCGSTVLHQQLANHTGWTTPRTWQCFSPADFLIKPRPPDRQVSRPMDEGLIGTFTPQEDEFAALLLGERSLYRGFIDPRRLGVLGDMLGEWKHVKVSEPQLSARWETFLKAVSLAQTGPMLIKSPNHTFRIPWLAARFPQAKFVWLTRRNDEVLASNRRMWLSMIQRYSLWNFRSDTLDRFLNAALTHHDELLEWARSNLGERLVHASFDDVMNDRVRLTARLCGQLLEVGRSA